jgi:hypothetical protein
MNLATFQRRNYDLEISDFPIRDPDVARQLIEMGEWCPEVATSLRILSNDIFSSEDGDDQGFRISDTLNDDETPVDPDVKSICDRLLEQPNLIGGLALERAVKRILGYGDAFMSVGIDREGIGRGDWGISRTLMLPTWEMFRLETDDGTLLGYEQRKRVQDSEPIQFAPVQVVHFRYDQNTLYGTALFRQSIQDWKRLKEATEDLAAAGRALGCNPNLHKMPEGSDSEFMNAYRNDYEAQMADGIVTDFYMLPGGDVQKLANNNPDLSALANNVLLWRSRIIMASQIPSWRFAGLPVEATKDVSGQPAKAYARFINGIRMQLSEGIKQVLDTELILRLGLEAFVERGRYQIAWPDIVVDPMAKEAVAAPDEKKTAN